MATEKQLTADNLQTVTLAGRRFVILPEAEYLRLHTLEDEAEPELPQPGADGNYPALEAMRVTLVRRIMRRRRALGLTQVELARRAGIRPETLNRLEQAKHTPSIATVEKLDLALREAEAEESKGSSRRHAVRNTSTPTRHD